MQCLDVLRISLLASLTGCSVDLEGGDDGQTTTTASSSDSGGAEGAELGTGEDTVCTIGCEGALEIAEGIAQCPDGRINRIGSGSFDPTINAASCAGTETNLYCTTDADCTGTHSKCISESTFDEFGEVTYCTCANACASDSDCVAGSVCMPPGVLGGRADWPTCMAVSCATNSDCGECGECGLGAFDDGCVWIHTAKCRTAEDTCVSDDDCAGTENCIPLDGPTWACNYGGCAIGRPLLVDTHARTAPGCERSDWAQLPAQVDALEPDARLATHWAELAALEHASVASFARFGVQLLALGAPARLLRACKRAALDEIEHARLTYGLASAYAGAPIGPGQLSLRDMTIKTGWREVVGALITEACVGETLGVAEAMVAAEQARVPVVRAVLERIAADELRHAQLAWQSLAWLLSQANEHDRAWAHALLARALTALETTAGLPATPDRPSEGVLGGRRRTRLHRDVGAQVIAPLAQAVIAA